MIPPNTSSRADILELESLIIGARAAPCTHHTHLSDRPMTYRRARAFEAHQQTPAAHNNALTADARMTSNSAQATRVRGKYHAPEQRTVIIALFLSAHQ